MLNDYFIEFYFINITIYFTLYLTSQPFSFQMFQQNFKSSISYKYKGQKYTCLLKCLYSRILCAIYEWGLRDVVRGEINVLPVWMAGDLWRSFLGSVAGMTLQGNSYLIRIKSSLSVTWGLDPVSVTREERLTNTPNIYQIWLSLIF